jgi:thiamine kinase-like enzyme
MSDVELPGEVMDLIAVIPHLAGTTAGELQVRPLQGGPSLNNTSWHVTAAGREYVLRVAAAGAVSHLGVRRSEELGAARAAAAAGVGPPLLYADETAGHTLTPFIPGRHWERTEFCLPRNITRVAQTLRLLHSITGTPGENGSVYRRVERLLENSAALGLSLPPNINDYRRRLKDIEAERASCQLVPSGLNHNDFWANNFLDDGETLWLLDWEFAGRGDGLYDLATAAMAGGLAPEEEARLVGEYGLDPAEGRNSLRQMRWVVLFFEAAWALVMHGLRGPESGYDYGDHSHKMFARMADG